MKRKKKKLKLKSNVKLILFVLVVLICIIAFANKKYQEYLYTKTSEYALLQLGYTEDEVKLFEKKMDDDTLWYVVNNIKYSEFLSHFVECKYFIPKNIDAYLSKTVTKDQDFWHYKEANQYDYDSIIAKVNTKVIYDQYTNTTATDMSKGYGILVNKYYYLASDYSPEDLVDVPWKYRFGGANDKIYIRNDAYEAFLEMWNDAQEAGFYLLIDSGFRNYQDQETIYNQYANKSGISYADSIAARPGFSEHQTGLAIDLYSKQNSSASTFSKSEVYAWLIKNCCKYGFILRYPEGKSKLTGYNFESWHYRYVGKDLAKKVVDSGLTFDEYYAYYLDK